MATADKKTGIFATKPIDVLIAETEEKDTQLKRAVGALDLTALGLGAIIGTGTVSYTHLTLPTTPYV